MSLAWDYRNRIMAEQQRAAAMNAARRGDAVTAAKAAHNSRFELLLTAIKTECDRISAIPRGAARLEPKREAIKTYLPEINQYINDGKVFENTALTQVMIWCFDVGDIENAMRLARVAIEQKQPLPERFNRNIKTGVCDFLYDWCRLRQVEKKTLEPYFSEVYSRLFPKSGVGWQVCDEIRLKYVKMKITETGDPREALTLCELAERIDPVNARVKTRKEKLLKEIAILDEKAKYGAR